MLVGSSRVDITPKELCTVCGQMYVRQAEYVHDPLYCNTVVFKNKDKLFVFVSNDVITMNQKMVPQLKKELSEKYNAPEKCFCFHAIHTHCAPYTNDNPGIDKENTEFVKNWEQAILKSVEMAMDNMEECDIYSGADYIENLGFNRRGRKKDGSVEMYWGAWNNDFIGCEGPRDGEVTVLFAKRKSDNSLKVIVPNFSTHPNSIEGGYFISADLVGRTRQVLRSIFGENVDIVYITGAAGNTSPTDLYRKYGDDERQFWKGEDGWNRSGIYLGSEIAKIICATCEPMEDNILDVEETNIKVEYRDLEIKIDKSKDTTFGGFENVFYETLKELKDKRDKEGSMSMNITCARIGNTSVCTSQGELYCEFGLSIKAESPSEYTIISELTNGNIGYIPTNEATINGGYSATIPGTVCKQDTGYRVAKETKRMLLSLYKEQL